MRERGEERKRSWGRKGWEKEDELGTRGVAGDGAGRHERGDTRFGRSRGTEGQEGRGRQGEAVEWEGRGTEVMRAERCLGASVRDEGGGIALSAPGLGWVSN